MQTSRKKLNIAIAVLAILLGLSLLALGGTWLVRYITASRTTTVVVPDNLIDPAPEDGNLSKPIGTASGNGTATAGAQETSPSGEVTGAVNEAATPAAPEQQQTEAAAPNAAAPNSSSRASTTAVTAEAFTLFNRKPDDNIPFEVKNMFPGDAETKYYCVSVYYKGDIIVRYHADVREGYEKLAEVLKVRIRLLDEDEVLYDGLMRDMPQSLNHPLKTNETKHSELYYEITTYLDTSVGNEYMDKDLVADFRWWVEETGNLVSPFEPPQTGDSFNSYVWISLAAGSLLMIFILLVVRRKGEKKDAESK